MAQSSQQIYDKMMKVQKQMDPLLGEQGNAGKYFQDAINKAYGYNLPAIQNAAALESRAYSLPGELNTQYDKEYGSNGGAGIGGMAKMNSILKNIGSQFGMSNAAWNLVDKNKMRMDELAKGVTEQYMGNLDALKTKWGMLNPLWSTMYGEEQANARAAASRAQDDKWKKLQKLLNDKNKQGTTGTGERPAGGWVVPKGQTPLEGSSGLNYWDMVKDTGSEVFDFLKSPLGYLGKKTGWY